tara:strand:- start:568 stop:834 length:267 start_codon:yes stop_codon:yes gene_type:complete
MGRRPADSRNKTELSPDMVEYVLVCINNYADRMTYEEWVKMAVGIIGSPYDLKVDYTEFKQNPLKFYYRTKDWRPILNRELSKFVEDF